MRTHIRVLGWLHLFVGLVDVAIAVMIFGIFASVGLMAGASGEVMGLAITGAIGTFVGGLMVLTAIPNFLVGWGLLTLKNWARLLALVLAAFNVFKFPWGTAVGVYSFVVLLSEDAKFEFGAK